MREERPYSFAFFISLVLDPCDICLFFYVDFKWNICISIFNEVASTIKLSSVSDALVGDAPC